MARTSPRAALIGYKSGHRLLPITFLPRRRFNAPSDLMRLVNIFES